MSGSTPNRLIYVLKTKKLMKELLALRRKYDAEREYDPVAIEDLARLG